MSVTWSRRGAAVSVVLLLLALNPVTGSGLDAEHPSLDGSIRDADLQQDSRDDLYRAPSGAVPAGTPVSLRMRAAMGDLERGRGAPL